MEVYIYCADIYCEDCAKDIKKTIRQEAKAKGIKVSEYVEMGHSDSWPQGPYPDGGGEADSPHHCGSHESCLNAEVLKDGTKVGCFLENPLTKDGVAYVKEALKEAKEFGRGNSEVLEMWAKYYSEELKYDRER